MKQDSRALRVWPTPPDGETYVKATLVGGEYISTGMFLAKQIDARGRGRSFDNCVAVTSLFFDLDLLPLYDAARAAKGAILELRAQDRKEKLYAEDPEMVQAFKTLLRDEFVSALEDVVGYPPTLLIDSGWGYHIHYAVAEEMWTTKAALRKLVASIISEANARCQDRAARFSPPIRVDSAFDATHDVGARLARLPGSKNLKAKGQPIRVEIVGASHTLLDRRILLALQSELTQDGVLPEDGVDIIPTAARPQTARRVDCDFRAQSLLDGRSWQLIASSLAPGERTKVVCPYGGTSVGSGFFACEQDGRVRFYSSPTDTTYWNTYKPVTRAGLADLIRLPAKRGQMQGDVQRTVTNLLRLLGEDGNFDLWYDLFRQREMDAEEAITDQHWMKIQAHMETAYSWTWRPGQATVWAAIESVCRARSRNPVTDYLDGLKWDGVPRLDRWIAETTGATDTDLFRAYSRKWAVGMMARVYKPGCKLDTSLCFSGPQGYGKSTIFREWVNWDGFEDLFCDTRIDLRGQAKDAYMTLHSCLVYEDAEMAAQSSADNESRKAFLSSQVDRFRPPFGRKMREYRRHTVIVATTNSKEFLRDKSGSRRHWVVAVNPDKDGKEGLEWLRKNRAQMLAEAVVAYKSGETWWLTPAQDEQRVLSNRVHEIVDWYTQCAQVLFSANGGGPECGITIAQFARAIDNKLNAQSRSISLSAALYRAGMSRHRSNGVTIYYKIAKNKHNDNGLRAVEALHERSYAQRLNQVS
tara:strand:- start:1308 stop:3569 length:2262 start_codon:yes stop_codon:yes gene_type:complete